MSIATRTVTVNAAFLQEIKDDNRELRRLLAKANDLFSWCGGGRAPARELVETLGGLRDQLAIHFSLEEAYGYFEEAVDVAPRLSEKAERLRGEHETLFLDACDLVDRAEQLLYVNAAAAATKKVALRFVAFRREFQEHESNEEELILQALDDDIGVGD